MLGVMLNARARLLALSPLALLAFAAACGGGDAGPAATASTTASTGATTTSGQPTQPAGAAKIATALPDCGPPGQAPKATSFAPSSDPAKSIPPDQLGTVNAVPAGADFYVGSNNFVFGLTNKQDQPQGQAKTRVTFYDLRTAGSPKPVCQAEAIQGAPGVGPKVDHTHDSGEVHTHGGEDDDRVGYFVRVNFTYAGFWGIVVEAELKDGSKGFSAVQFPVLEKPAIPSAGTAAIKSDNLTKNDVADIREIDSGTPPNDMHEVKIKDAIAKGRPLVVVFSTPAFCTSRFCGPVNEEVEALQTKYRDAVDFVHVEIWRDFGKQQLSPTAREWLVRKDGGLSEPYVYIIGKNGVIYDRFEGPVAANIMEPGVKAVADGAVFAK